MLLNKNTKTYSIGNHPVFSTGVCVSVFCCDYLSLREVAKRLNITHATVKARIKSTHYPYVLINDRYFIPEFFVNLNEASRSEYVAYNVTVIEPDNKEFLKQLVFSEKEVLKHIYYAKPGWKIQIEKGTIDKRKVNISNNVLRFWDADNAFATYLPEYQKAILFLKNEDGKTLLFPEINVNIEKWPKFTQKIAENSSDFLVSIKKKFKSVSITSVVLE